MSGSWRWFRGSRGRIIVVHLPVAPPPEEAWDLLSVGPARIERFLGVPHPAMSRGCIPPHGPDATPWRLRQDRALSLTAPTGERFHEIVPVTRARLLKSRLVWFGTASCLSLGGLAWIAPSTIRLWTDRPVPQYERITNGQIQLDRAGPRGARALWKPGAPGWTRVTLPTTPPGPAPLPETPRLEIEQEIDERTQTPGHQED
jgi:hypothetical protein